MAEINSTTGHEGEVIDVQGLKASLQKLKAEKVDPKVTEGYYYEKKFYKEDAHTTEITGTGGRIYIDKPTNREYRWDGTKYVLLKSEVDGSFVNEGTFTYRPTAGAIDVESAAVGEGGAQIECVKGNTIAWNQLYNNSAPTATTGHKYLISENNSGTVSRSISETISYTSDSIDRMCIDLTLIYGEGNEPTTVEQFEADYQKWFGKPLTYEEYDEGSLRSVEMTGIKSVGFNQWDEEWRNGYYDQLGEFVSNSTVIASKNPIPVIPEATYFHYYAQGYNGRYCFYDYSMNLISYIDNVILFTVPKNAAYMHFDMIPSYGSTYKHDICLHLVHSGDRNGDYEPYWEHTANLPVTSLKGKLNGEGESVVIFPDGMKKAGTVYDEIVKRGNQTVAIKRIGSRVYSEGDFSDSTVVTDGTTTYYALSESEEYIIDDIDFPTEYPVDDYGTEEILSDSAKSLAPTLDIRYGLNATDTLRNLPTKYVSAIVEQNFTEEQKTRARINIGLDNLSRLGGGYGTCYTDATTAAKAVSISHFLLLVNGIVSVRFTKAISVDNATLNVSGSGAKPIFINGAALQAGLVKVDDVVTLIYDGTNWNIVDIMTVAASKSGLCVDMGLPSGLRWAIANLDATTQSGFAEVDGKPSPFKYECSFFSWGNVDGHNPISDTEFSYNWGEGLTMDTYENTPGAQLTANAGLSYDAARAILGAPWRDPSTEDFVELFNNIDYVQADGETVIDTSIADKRVTVNSITGIYLKSKINGKLLFFPCSGFGSGNGDWSSRGSTGRYWSHSLYSQEKGGGLYIKTSDVNPQYSFYRYYGIARRAVQ